VTLRLLGDTTRPRELVAGDADSVRTTASRLRSRADRIDDVSTRLRRLDLAGVWEGEAAMSFLNAVAEFEPHVDVAAEADRAAAKALTVYARVLEDAQATAARAIELWQHGEHATRAAERDQIVALYGASSELLFDPGEEQRANARRILLLAREGVSDAGNRAASALQDSQSAHASTVGFWDVVGVAMNVTVGETLRGIGNGVASFVNAVAQHPDEWIALLLGVGSMEGGVAAFTGGVALDATVAGAPAGVAVNVAAAGVVAGGAAVTAASMSKLLQQAAGEDRVQPFTNEATGASKPAGYPGRGGPVAQKDAVEALEKDAVRAFANRAEARADFPENLCAAANKFFKQATSKCQDFVAEPLSGGGYRMRFFAPANNPGYGKLYVQEIDSSGTVISDYKDTVGPQGLIERKWVPIG
jgi:uncharacterized protein YukE